MNAVVGFGLLAVVVIIAGLVAATAIPARERKQRPVTSPGARDDAAERASMARLHSGAAAERVASPAFRSAFAPWEEAPQPARVQETFVPDPAEQPLPAETPSNEVAEHEPPRRELAPWVLAELTRQHNPGANIDSIVARVVQS